MTHQLTLNNIKCGGCANSILNKLSSIDGITKSSVNVEDGIVSFDAHDQDSYRRGKQALSQMGYTEEDPTILQSARSYVSCMIGRVSQ